MEALNQTHCAQVILDAMRQKTQIDGKLLEQIVPSAVAIDAAYMQRVIQEGKPYDEEDVYRLLVSGLKVQYPLCNDDCIELYMEQMECYLDENGAIDWQ